MKRNFIPCPTLFLCWLCISQLAVAQNSSLSDSTKCIQVLDTLSHRQLVRSPEVPAAFRGGAEGFQNYFARNFRFERNEVQYRMTLVYTFIVEPNGKVSNVSFAFGPSKGNDAIVKKGLIFFEQLPRFKPAMCNNVNVATRVMQPIVLVPNFTPSY